MYECQEPFSEQQMPAGCFSNDVEKVPNRAWPEPGCPIEISENQNKTLGSIDLQPDVQIFRLERPGYCQDSLAGAFS
jgi:hypothetical protein